MRKDVKFFSTKLFETIMPLRVKNPVKIYWPDPIESCCTLQDLLM